MSEQGRLLRAAQHAPPIAGSGGGHPARAISRRAQAALPLSRVGAGMVVRRVSVRPSDVVFVKGIVEASEGLAGVFAERGGELLLAAPRGREAELGELLKDLAGELDELHGRDAEDP
jgi:hypothetical protein